MKVYILYGGLLYGSILYGIFTTKEKAEEYRNKLAEEIMDWANRRIQYNTKYSTTIYTNDPVEIARNKFFINEVELDKQLKPDEVLLYAE